jgi:hypothetical protein
VRTNINSVIVSYQNFIPSAFLSDPIRPFPLTIRHSPISSITHLSGFVALLLAEASGRVAYLQGMLRAWRPKKHARPLYSYNYVTISRLAVVVVVGCHIQIRQMQSSFR